MNTIRKIFCVFFAHVMCGLLLFFRWKRKTVIANLRHIGGEGSSKRNVLNDIFFEKMYRKILRHLTRDVGELLFCMRKFKNLPSETSLYPCNMNGEKFDLAQGSAEVLEKMRNGGIFLTAHYGNYEAMGPWLCRLRIPLVASYIPIKPKFLNHILERHIRSVDGNCYSVNARTPRDFLRLLDDKKLFCLLADQDSRTLSAIEGKFMGKNVCCNPLPDFLLKYRPKTPVFFCWIEKNGKYVLHAEEVYVSNDSGMVHQSLMAQFNYWLETRINKTPELWYGFTHRRFYSKNPKIY